MYLIIKIDMQEQIEFITARLQIHLKDKVEKVIFALPVAKINNRITYKDNNNMKFKVVVPRKKGKDNMEVYIETIKV